ncbi:hypothetical protein LOB65_08870, partial [Lactobacillus delbrueckii subsp. lactis]|nr:hypothetical protein [Lactobacillus delbrueckii subsp. lactis]
MEFIRSHKRLLAIFGLIVVLLLGTLLLLKHVDNSASAILEARITADDDSGTSFATIYDNGKVEKSRSSQNKKFVKPIEVDPQVFVEHTDKKNNIYANCKNKLNTYHNIWQILTIYAGKCGQVRCQSTLLESCSLRSS